MFCGSSDTQVEVRIIIVKIGTTIQAPANEVSYLELVTMRGCYRIMRFES